MKDRVGTSLAAIHTIPFAFPAANCIFTRVSINNYIFSAIFVLVSSLLHVQPLFHQYEGNTEQSCSKSSKPSCNNSSSPEAPSKDCSNKACNPFLPCSMGSCCYVAENMFNYSTATTISTKKIAPFNDNRILTKISECWHPPEAIS